MVKLVTLAATVTTLHTTECVMQGIMMTTSVIRKGIQFSPRSMEHWHVNAPLFSVFCCDVSVVKASNSNNMKEICTSCTTNNTPVIWHWVGTGDCGRLQNNKVIFTITQQPQQQCSLFAAKRPQCVWSVCVLSQSCQSCSKLACRCFCSTVYMHTVTVHSGYFNCNFSAGN